LFCKIREIVTGAGKHRQCDAQIAIFCPRQDPGRQAVIAGAFCR
jgi:hypothetical protein